KGLSKTMAATTTTRHSRKTSKTLLEPTGKELETYEAPKLVIPVNPSRDHIQGDPKAVLTLVEYGDYQCPFCGVAYPEVKKVKKLGLDAQRFEREISQHVDEKRIKDDFMGGVRSGVNGTPTFYVNGVRHDGPPEAEAIIESLKAKP